MAFEIDISPGINEYPHRLKIPHKYCLMQRTGMYDMLAMNWKSKEDVDGGPVATRVTSVYKRG